MASPTIIAQKPGVTVIQGDKELQALCASLAYKVKNTIARQVLTVEANRLMPMSRDLVHVRTGDLKRSLIVAVKMMPRKGRIRVTYGPKKERVVRDMDTGLTGLFQGRMSLAARQKYKVLRDPTRYAHLLELGTRPHTVRARAGKLLQNPLTGQTYGRQVTISAKPYPFMAPVFTAQAPGALHNILAEARRMIEAAVNKARTRALVNTGA